MKVLVTGANGYLGKGIVRQLLDDGVAVIASDINTNGCDERAVIHECNLFSLKNPYDYFNKPEVVLHLAWQNGFIHDAESHVENLYKHYSFLKKLVDAGVQRLAVMGSMHEIGFFEGSIKEDTPTNPMNLYGISKDSLRKMVKLMCMNASIPFQWLRGYYIVGNSEYGNSIFSKITTAEKEGKTTYPFTFGQNQWDFLDYDDFCFQTASAIEQSNICGIINICSGHPEKLADRVERFIKENAYNIKLEYGKFPDRPYDSKAVWGDNSKIEEILRFRSKDGLNVGI